MNNESLAKGSLDEDVDFITEESVDSKIQAIAFWQPEGTTLTVAAAFLNNGSVVLGHSNCINKKVFDVDTGQRVAFGHAKSKIWELEAYLANEKASQGQVVPLPDVVMGRSPEEQAK